MQGKYISGDRLAASVCPIMRFPGPDPYPKVVYMFPIILNPPLSFYVDHLK